MTPLAPATRMFFRSFDMETLAQAICRALPALSGTRAVWCDPASVAPVATAGTAPTADAPVSTPWRDGS